MGDHAKSPAIILAVGIFGVVDAAEVHQLLELTTFGIAQDMGSRLVVASTDHDSQLTERDRDTFGFVAQSSSDDTSEFFGRRGMQRTHQALAMVLVRRIFCCNWMMP